MICAMLIVIDPDTMLVQFASSAMEKSRCACGNIIARVSMPNKRSSISGSGAVGGGAPSVLNDGMYFQQSARLNANVATCSLSPRYGANGAWSEGTTSVISSTSARSASADASANMGSTSPRDPHDISSGRDMACVLVEMDVLYSEVMRCLDGHFTQRGTASSVNWTVRYVYSTSPVLFCKSYLISLVDF